MANNEPKKSKYFKDADSKPTSKYIKSEGAQSKSKYFKTDADRKAEQDRRANRSTRSTSYHKNAASTNLENRTRTQQGKTSDRPKGKLPQEISSLDEVRESKGDHTSIFTNQEADKDAYKHYKEVEETPDDNRRATQIVRTALIVGAMLIVAVVLNFVNVQFNWMPSILSVEFSAIPEFIVALAYGPVFGVAIVLIKNVAHMIINQPSFVSEMQNFVLDSFFIFLGGWIYTRRMFTFKSPKRPEKIRKGKDYRTRRIMLAGFTGTIATSIATFFTTRFVSYPLLIRLFSDRGYSDTAILYSYQESLDKVNAALPAFLSGRITSIDNSFVRAILLYNVPLTFCKFLFITIIVALLYPPISDFLHYRVRSKRR